VKVYLMKLYKAALLAQNLVEELQIDQSATDAIAQSTTEPDFLTE